MNVLHPIKTLKQEREKRVMAWYERTSDYLASEVWDKLGEHVTGTESIDGIQLIQGLATHLPVRKAIDTLGALTTHKINARFERFGRTGLIGVVEYDPVESWNRSTMYSDVREPGHDNWTVEANPAGLSVAFQINASGVESSTEQITPPVVAA
jgi:hypothetical protein